MKTGNMQRPLGFLKTMTHFLYLVQIAEKEIMSSRVDHQLKDFWLRSLSFLATPQILKTPIAAPHSFRERVEVIHSYFHKTFEMNLLESEWALKRISRESKGL
jgi:hypothetical protein